MVDANRNVIRHMPGGAAMNGTLFSEPRRGLPSADTLFFDCVVSPSDVGKENVRPNQIERNVYCATKR